MNSEDELWYVWQRVYDEASDGWDECGIPGIAGCDLSTAQAEALTLYLQDHPEVQASETTWHEEVPGEWFELHHAGEETGYYVNHQVLWDGGTPYPEP